MIMNKTSILFGVSILLLFGCAPKLIIHHLDHTHPKVAVKIDEKDQGTLEYGGKISKRLSPGPHYVEAVPDGETGCPWVKNGDGWVVYIDEGAQLTLLPVSKPPPQPASQASNKREKTASPEQSNPYGSGTP